MAALSLSLPLSVCLAGLLACTAFRVGVRNPNLCALALRRLSNFGLGVRLRSGGTSWTTRLASSPSCPFDRVIPRGKLVPRLVQLAAPTSALSGPLLCLEAPGPRTVGLLKKTTQALEATQVENATVAKCLSWSRLGCCTATVFYLWWFGGCLQ